MGLRGPTRKSADLRVLEGSRAHRPLPAPGPKYIAGMPERPKGMSAAAKRVWDGYIEQLATLGILRPVDGFALSRLCEDVAMLQDLQAGQRKLVREMRRAAKEASERLAALDEKLAAPATPEEQAAREALELEREELRARSRQSGGALIELTMSPEGRRLATTINTLASRIKRDELQFGLTPVASQRLENIVIPQAVTAAGMDPVEAALCG